MSNLTPVIDHIDGLNRRIYLKQGVIDFFPIEDIYHEYRTLRRNDTDQVRKYNALLKAEGNISKGAGAFTPRYVVLLEGTKIVPFDEASQLNQLGDMITDDPDTDPTLYDISGLTTAKPIFIKPSEAETIQLNSESIVYSSFGGGVWIDVNSIYSDKGSATEPNGNQERPVNNTQLAVQIALERGFKTLFVISDLTLDTGDDVTDFKMVGQSHVNTNLIINPGSICLRTAFSEFNLTGTMDGDSDIVSCIVGDIQYFNGHIHNSYLYGTFTLGGTDDARIDDCKILNVANPVTITAGISGQDIMITNYSGRIILDNIIGSSNVGIGLDAGEVVINSNCTAGTIALSGNGDLIDNSTDTCYVINKLVNGSEIQGLQKLVEGLRPHHTGTGDIWYWNPYNGNDTFDGTTPNTACKTFAYVHDNLVKNANHDIIYCIPGDPSGVTTSLENITISHDYLFLRGPGRDFELGTGDDTLPTVTITGRGAELSGLRVKSSLVATAPVIHTTGNFSLFKNIWVANSNDGIHIENAEYCIVDDVKSHHNNGYGILIDGTSEHTDIIDCHIGSNGGDGVTINLDSGFHEVNILGSTIIHKNTGYGVNISATTASVIFGKDVELFSNTLGDINDLGTGTYIPTSGGGTSPQEIWEYSTRELTVASGMTPSQEAKLDDIKSDTGYQERMVFINTELIPIGDGTSENPYNNIGDTLDFAEANGIRKIIVLSDITLDRQLKNFVIEGVGTPAIDCNGQKLDKSEFSRVMMNGTHLGRIVVQEAVLMDGFTLYGFFEKCALGGDLICIGDTLLANCFSNIAGLARPSLSVDGHKVSVRNYSGGLEVRDCDSAISEITLELTGKAYITNTCILGIISVRGNATLDDQSNGSIVDVSALLNQELTERVTRANLKIVGTQLIAEDSLGEIQRWNLSDSTNNPSNENVFNRIQV